MAKKKAAGRKPSAKKSGIVKGDKVIVRCRDAGVHFGVYLGHSGREVRIKNGRRLWYWKAAGDGKTLSCIANSGLDASKSKVGKPVEFATLLEACEILLCTKPAAASVEGAAWSG